MENIYLFIEILSKYIATYLFFFLVGRSFILISYKKFKNKILFLSKEIIYPIIGLIVSGNVLVILNFFIPLKSGLVFVIFLIIVLYNLWHISFNFKKIITFKNIFYYLIIPSILLISSFNISFHYDAGYYHLNNQNWLRNSNLIMGFVNIFWAFGMSSIYEYISAILWFDSNLLNLHYLNLIFIHFLYLFFLDSILESKNSFFKNVSFLIIGFSILDNFGFMGGRNGFIYIEGVGKQDVVVGILFFLITMISCLFLSINEPISKLDFTIYSLLILFTIQIKLNSVIIFLLYLIIIYKQFRIRKSIKEIFQPQIITIIFGLIWLLKNYLTTGCFVFPLNVTCINNFSWYTPESTKAFEIISKQSSLNYEFGTNFNTWFIKFSEYNFYISLIQNFLISFGILFVIRQLFFNKIKKNTYEIAVFIIFVFVNFIYLIFFGPIPRYAIGLLMSIIGGLAIGTGSLKLRTYKSAYILILISIVFLIRYDSYFHFIQNEDLIIFDPREKAQYIDQENNWVLPDEGDQCWINLDCTMNDEGIRFEKNGLFNTAYNY